MLIDLSLTISEKSKELADVSIDYISHKQGAEMLGEPAGLKPADFPDGLGLSLEKISLTSHTGTHIDAPLHYGPFSEGKPSKSVAELPLKWFYSDAVVLRLNQDYAQGDVAVNEVRSELERINYQIKENDIVLLHTGADKLWGDDAYLTQFRGISREATEWIIDQGVKVIGVDTFGFDAPFKTMLERYKRTLSKDALWPAHILGRDKEYCQIERLANLDKIPVQYGFKVAFFPVKIENSGAGWTRAVALIGGQGESDG
ncbi:MAG: cyclase family protein [Gammaproteobacteria bacterium]|nr:cyclase family protein [Gammaproteobacteria bacterium]